MGLEFRLIESHWLKKNSHYYCSSSSGSRDVSYESRKPAAFKHKEVKDFKIMSDILVQFHISILKINYGELNMSIKFGLPKFRI